MSSRPDWLRRVDRAAAVAARLVEAVLPRPTERQLQELAGRSRGARPRPLREPGYAELLEGARAALAAGRFGDALAGFHLAAESAPDEPWPWHGRGDVLQLSGEPEGALAAYDEALRREPELALSWSGRGNALESLGRLEEAELAWRRALDLEPGLRWAEEGLSRLRTRRAMPAPGVERGAD